jgi:hypothetical protein
MSKRLAKKSQPCPPRNLKWFNENFPATDYMTLLHTPEVRILYYRPAPLKYAHPNSIREWAKTAGEYKIASDHEGSG